MSSDISDEEQPPEVLDEDGSEAEPTPAESAQEEPEEEEEEEGGFIRRRTLLASTAGLIAAVLAFIALNPEPIRDFFRPTHESAGEEAWLAREEETTDDAERIVGTVRLESGQFVAQSFWAERAGADLSWSVADIDGGTLDVWVLPDDHIDRYIDDEDPRFNSDLSETGLTSSGERTGSVTDDSWWVVLDNSSLYGSDADDEVVFDVEMGIRS